MKSLLSVVGTGEFEDDGWMRLIQTAWLENKLELVFELNVDGNESSIQKWSVVAKNIHEYKIFEAYDCGLNHCIADHVAIRQFTDNRAKLFFNGKATNPEQLLGGLFEAHYDCVDDWIEFDRYININSNLSKLFSDGYGLLADGPLFLLEKYSDVLRAQGISWSITNKSNPSYWENGAFHEYSKNLEMIHFGGSYVVADEFFSEKTE